MRFTKILKKHLSTILTQPVLGRVISMLKTNVNFHGAQVNIKNPFLPYRVRAAVFWNLYESAEARLLKQWLPKDIPVIELGASLGIISKLIRHLTRQPIYCVEANPLLISSIGFNLDSEKNSKHYIIQKAIHYSEDFVTFTWNEGDNLTGRIDQAGAERVECITVSAIIQANQWSDIALVMDIEGAEIEIIKEDVQGLQCCKIIIAELHTSYFGDRFYTVEDLSVLIQDRGFKQVARDGNCFTFQRMEDNI